MKLSNALMIGAEMLSRSSSPELDARLLLQHALGVERSHLIAHADDLLTGEQVNSYFALIARAEQSEPIPYIIGSVGFRYIELMVTSAVLIPRPETEELVEKVLRWAKGRRELRIVDVGTGSGCIAISLAKELEGAAVIAVEVSAEALKIAQQNALNNNATVEFHQGSLLKPIAEPVDLIVANLPYVAETERALLDKSVARFEPQLALFGGEDGLDLVRELLRQAVGKLRPKGAIFLEIGFQQGVAVVAIAQQHFPNATVTCQQDYAGQDRFVSIAF